MAKTRKRTVRVRVSSTTDRASGRSTKQVRSKKAAKTVAGRPSAPTYVYSFGAGKADGDRSMRDLLGGKGAGLAEMTNAGLPVPPGFTITTEACNLYYANKCSIPSAVDGEMLDRLRQLEKAVGASFGSESRSTGAFWS